MDFKLYQPEGDPRPMPDFAPLSDLLSDAGTYLPSEELVAAVNVALALGQPLLLTGEPGTGKTQLAYHIVRRFLGLNGPYVFEAQTNSVKKDLFYT
ncbi:MAG: MoxR family ATPase, partial [Saprospiraceae bacterium]|nr:MoxR family ATPase [Saprospiraceae bacterium]